MIFVYNTIQGWNFCW